MAYTMTNQSPTKKEGIIFMPFTQSPAYTQLVPENSDFSQWWQENRRWYAMTELIEHGRIPLSNDQQYRQELAREGKLEHIPGLPELYTEIAELRNIEEDWNGEGAPVTDIESIERAEAFLKALACEGSVQTEQWHLPSVFPTIDGGVQLYWNKKDGQIAMSFRPDRHGIDYRNKLLGAPSQRQYLSEEEAIQYALRAIRRP